MSNDFIIIYDIFYFLDFNMKKKIYLESKINSLGYPKLSENEVVSLLLKRDESGFNYLYDNYSAAIYGIILKVVVYNEDANEVMQDAFVKIWNSIDQFDNSKGTLYTWMLNIARNTAIDRLKSKAFQNSLKNQTLPDFVHNSEELSSEQKHNFQELEHLINSLKEEYRVIIHKAYYGGFTQEEISEELGIPLGTVKTRTRAALMELRNLLKEFKR